MGEGPQDTLPAELQRYTIVPPWADRQRDEERRRRALRELQERLARRG
jgi:hypothetical protein